MSKCLQFSQGLKFKANFYSKKSVCRQELGVQPLNPPRQFQPWDYPAVNIRLLVLVRLPNVANTRQRRLPRDMTQAGGRQSFPSA